MPLIYFSSISENRAEFFFAEAPARKFGGHTASTSIQDNFKSKYDKLPDLLKSCLDYCCLVTFKYSREKDKLARLLVAEDLVPEITVAEMIINDLIGLGMLGEEISREYVKVDDKYKEVCLLQVEENEFIAQSANSHVCAVIEDDGKQVPPNFKTLQIHSLFLINSERLSQEGLSRAYIESICSMQSLVVLDLNGRIECLPDAIGNLVHLRYLGLLESTLDELPQRLRNLQNLQTLDIRGSRLGILGTLPSEVLNIKQLRHLLVGLICGIKVPNGFREMENLQTCDGIYGGGAAAQELGNLIQLRKLSVESVADDHADELATSISKMTNLVCLSLAAEGGGMFQYSMLPVMKQFCPPPLLQELHLNGGLVEIPNWVFSMENLTTLYLSISRLLESQTSVLQLLPKLKHLSLWLAIEGKYISKRFCDAGGFPKLETLIIFSLSLVEWTEIVKGAFPSLRSLTFRNCWKLKFLPEGLQNVSALEELYLVPAFEDIGRRLNTEENYKIKHIKNVKLYELPVPGTCLR